MVRFKNRYLLFELVWKDGKLDDSISERGGSSLALRRSYCVLGNLVRKEPSLLLLMSGKVAAWSCPCTACSPLPPCPCGPVRAAEAGLLGAFRDSLQQNFGDHGLGCALASLQGAQALPC